MKDEIKIGISKMLDTVLLIRHHRLWHKYFEIELGSFCNKAQQIDNELLFSNE